MVGLLTQASQAEPEEAPSPDDDRGEAASAEEQEWYDGVQRAAGDILFKNDKGSEAILSMIDPKRPEETAGKAAAAVLIQVDRGMDGEIPETVILPAAEEILGHVLEIAEAARLLKRSDAGDEKAAQAMVAALTDEYGLDEGDFNEAQARIGAVT